MPAQVERELIDELARCNTATIGHFENGGFLPTSFMPVIAGQRIAGTVVTIQTPPLDSVLVHYAISGARPGDVLVIARGGETDHACWGGTTALAAKLAGVSGAIIDGPTTDVADQLSAAMPCWGRGTSPLTTKKLGLGGGLNVPVEIGGVVIRPGDAILADDNGVFISSPWRVAEITSEALARQARKPATVEQLQAGVKLGDLSGADAIVRRGLEAQGKTPPW
ncbi:RraA family protein [Mesorhizobium sp. CAU 1741]|uniref:RraA family protein n=1 Tax=Mesorhizobium sp. CAU 1741 TaxID=3140366 RepID=UPI00325ADD23